jgi:hypothetical protein
MVGMVVPGAREAFSNVVRVVVIITPLEDRGSGKERDEEEG